MRRSTFAIAALAAASAVLAACLVAPGEPSASSSNGLSCAPGSRAFNGQCRPQCQVSSQCAPGLKCMHIGNSDRVCLDYPSCAHLGSDTTCATASTANPYGVYPTYYGGYGYSSYTGDGNGCAGNAVWEVTPAVGDPQCGTAYDVARCRPVGNHCELVSGSTTDIAEP